MSFDGKYRDRKTGTTSPRWSSAFFPEDGTTHWLPWLAGPISPCIHAGLSAAADYAAVHGPAEQEAAVARQLPAGGGTQLPGFLDSIGRHIRKVEGDGNCAFHSVGAQLGQRAAAGTSGVYVASGAAKLRLDAYNFLNDKAPASWSALYGPVEWATVLRTGETDKGWVGSAALRALAVTTGRDIVLLNGVPRSPDCRVVIFYAEPMWRAPIGNLYDLLPPGSEALAAWLRDGSGGPAGAPARSAGAPMFVVWNGTNHFDSVEPVRRVPERGDATVREAAARPKAAPSPNALPPKAMLVTLPPALQHAAARAAHTAAFAPRSAGEIINAQRNAAIAACRDTAAASGHADSSLPCFMCGSSFLRMQTHWASRCNPTSGDLMGSPCALAWGEPATCRWLRALQAPPPLEAASKRNQSARPSRQLRRSRGRSRGICCQDHGGLHCRSERSLMIVFSGSLVTNLLLKSVPASFLISMVSLTNLEMSFCVI